MKTERSTTPSIVPKAAVPLSAKPHGCHSLTVQNKAKKTTQCSMQTCSHHRLLPAHKSPMTSHSQLLQPILDGGQHERCNSDVSQARKNHRSSHVEDTSADHITATTRRPGKDAAEACTQLLLPPAVEEPASSHTSALRTASDVAKVGLLRCALPSSCRTSSQRSSFAVHVWS